MKLEYIKQAPNGRYQYRRRVPTFVSQLDTRKEVCVSLKTKDKHEAFLKGQLLNKQLEHFWNTLALSGNALNVREHYKATVELARVKGFSYMTAQEISKSKIEDIYKRATTPINSSEEATAILGGIDIPTIMLSECLDLYWPLVADVLRNKSKDQLRKWKNPRKLAMKNFITLTKDKPLHTISRKDILSFHYWFMSKIGTGELSGEAGKKQLRHLKQILDKVAINNEINIDIDSMFVKTSFKHKYVPRPSFSASYVQSTLLPKLVDLNEIDRMIAYVMADTGARETEIVGLLPTNIFLDEDIPYISIEPRAQYELKTSSSKRIIPLVGTALYAFQKFPNGFNSLRSGDAFSNTIGKYLRENDLKPTPKHTIYSLRHTFKDRLRDIEAFPDLIDSLMGHVEKGMEYGRGYNLETKHKWLKKIAFEVE